MTIEWVFQRKNDTDIVMCFLLFRLDWMKSNKVKTEEDRRRTTERILRGVTRLLLGGAEPAPYLPQGGFQPFVKNFTKIKYRKSTNHHKIYHKNDKNDDNSSGFKFQQENGTEHYNRRDKDVQPHDQTDKDEEGYHKMGVPELGAFPHRRTLFSGVSHRVTRVPLSLASSPRGLPADGVWHSKTTATSKDSGESKRHHRQSRRVRTSNNPRRPATARNSRSYPRKGSSGGGGSSGGSGAYVQRRPKSAASGSGKGWV